ncbi:MAG TPA: hypothetical protein VGM84_10305 [Steroidobacteraceae bacterium]|jgi:hypothetical protein
MTTGIVSQLASWIREHAADLRQQGIQIEERIPDQASPSPWKASVGLIFNDIVVTYTVWERTILQTSLIVFNANTRRTVFFKDSEPETPGVVNPDLDDVVKKLASGEYSKMSSSQ